MRWRWYLKGGSKAAGVAGKGELSYWKEVGVDGRWGMVWKETDCVASKGQVLVLLEGDWCCCVERCWKGKGASCWNETAFFFPWGAEAKGQGRGVGWLCDNRG